MSGSSSVGYSYTLPFNPAPPPPSNSGISFATPGQPASMNGSNAQYERVTPGTYVPPPPSNAEVSVVEPSGEFTGKVTNDGDTSTVTTGVEYAPTIDKLTTSIGFSHTIDGEPPVGISYEEPTQTTP